MFYIILFFLLGIGLILAEFFLPGGLLGIVGAGSIITSIVIAYRTYPEFANYILLAQLVGTFIVIVIGIKLFPRTFMGRRVILVTRQDKKLGYSGTLENLKELKGKEGITISELRPGGIALIEKRRIDVVTEGIFVEKDRPIKVIEVEGNRVVVQEIEKKEKVKKEV